MGVYKCEIIKGFDDLGAAAYWRNVYHLNTPTIQDAADISDLVVSAEMALHATTVLYVGTVISDPTKVERRINKIGGTTHGDRTASGAIIPGWNVVVVGFDNASNPRPERKYYRVQLGEGDIVGSLLETTLVTTFQAVIDALTADVIALCAPNGDSIVGGGVYTQVMMRQLRWHRKSRPGFHRGYVPNT